MYVIVVVGRVGVCMLCACDSEESEHGVGAGVNTTMLSGVSVAHGCGGDSYRFFYYTG